MPKEPKKTKEELLVENTQIQQEIKRLWENNEIRRREFAKAFNWGNKSKSGYFESYSGNTNDRSNPSWEEIFVEVGKLLEIKNQIMLEENIKRLEEDNFKLRTELNNPIK